MKWLDLVIDSPAETVVETPKEIEKEEIEMKTEQEPTISDVYKVHEHVAYTGSLTIPLGVITMQPELTTTPEPVAQFVADPTPDLTVVSNVVAIPPEEAYRHKGMRYKLIYEGVLTNCAHCGMPLTDAESSQAGLGPICRKKGYTDEVEPVDPMDAMLALAEYPQLVDYLNAKYKPQGNRQLANGLVRTASLNRRTPVHGACTDALEALGYKRLASALRESIAVVEIYDSKSKPDHYGVWVKKSDFSWSFYGEVKQLTGVHMTKYPVKEIVVPRAHKRALAQLIVKYYEGFYVKTQNGSHKISPAWFGKG